MCSFSQVFKKNFYFCTVETYCYNITIFIKCYWVLSLGDFLISCKEIFYHCYLFSNCSEMPGKKIVLRTYFAIPFYWIRYPWSLRRSLFFCLNNMFYLVLLFFYYMTFRVTANPYLLCLSNIFYQIIFLLNYIRWCYVFTFWTCSL